MKNKPLQTFYIVLGIALFIIGIGCIITATVCQQILIYQKFGVIFGGDNFTIFIPHWSAWFYLGIIPTFLGYPLMLCGKD